MAIKIIQRDSGSVQPTSSDDMLFEEYIGLKMPLGLSPETSGSMGYFESTRYTSEAIKENVKNLLLTNKRERIFNLNMGINWNRFLFQPMNNDLRNEIRGEISHTLVNYMPFLKIKHCSVYDYKGYDNTGLGILLQIQYSGDSIPLHLVISGNNGQTIEAI